MMTLPETIKIGPHTYEVSVVDIKIMAALDINGDFNNYKQRIRLCASLKGTKLIEVLLHEILHAIYNQYSLEQKDKEERIVLSFGKGLTQVFVDNPDLLKFISKAT